MKDKKYILFDLDGTLTDSVRGITKSVQYALRHFGIEVEDLTQLEKFVGPPLRDSFRNFYGFDEADVENAVAKYREYYPVKGIFENDVYDGIPDLLDSLVKAGKHVLLATSKPEVFAVRIIKHFDLERYFEFVCGSCLDGSREKKSDVIGYVLKNVGVEDLGEAVMVGDRNYDIVGASQAGIDGIGVLYGYGTRDELEEAGAAAIAESVTDLKRILLG